MLRTRKRLGAIVVSALTLTAAGTAAGEVASALLQEDGPLPGGPAGEMVDSISNTAVNHVGGYAASINTVGSGDTLSRVWGSATGGPGGVLRTEATIGDLQQPSFESFYGISNAGEVSYSSSVTDLNSGTTGLDSVWIDGTLIQIEETPVASYPGFFSSFNSRPGVTADGIPYWVGGLANTQGGVTQFRVLFFSAAITPVIGSGDSVGGISEVVSQGSGVDFDFRFSEFGTNWIDALDVEGPPTNDGVVAVNGDALMAGGGVVRELSPVPASVGGLPGELWDNFDFFGITEAGHTLVTGDTNAATSMDEFVMINEMIVQREGDMVTGSAGTFPLAGSIEGGYLNEDVDWAVIWDVDTVDGNLEALLLNGELLLLEGDLVDWNNDGVVDAGDSGGRLANFTGITSLTLGPRDAFGRVSIYFTADIDFKGTSSSSDDREGFFCLSAQAAPARLPLDIKPGGCPNPLNRNSNGVLPVALLGTADVDVSMIDLDTILISRADGMGGMLAPHEGPPGPHTTVDDVAAPAGVEPCECAVTGPDGIDDLSLKFRTSELVSALELDSLSSGALVELVVTGQTIDGIEFEASDCVRLVPPGAGPMMLAVSSGVGNTWIDVSPLDLDLDGGGFDDFVRTYPEQSVVTLTAPLVNQGLTLFGWRVDGSAELVGGPTFQVVLDGNVQSVQAVYGAYGAGLSPTSSRPRFTR